MSAFSAVLLGKKLCVGLNFVLLIIISIVSYTLDYVTAQSPHLFLDRPFAFWNGEMLLSF